MLIDQFKEYNCIISEGVGSVFKVKSYRLKCPKVNLDQGFLWRTEDNLEVTLKNKVGRLMSALSNGATLDNTKIYNKDLLLEFIDDNFINLTPDAKLNSVLEFISARTKYDGEDIELPSLPALLIAKMYFYNLNEWRFYIKSAVAQGLVKKTTVDAQEPGLSPKHYYSLTVQGLSRLITVTEGKTSRYCFIAMAFTDDMFKVAEEALKPSLAACGFNGLMVSDQHVDSDKTINDAILASIKKSRFTIADFTHHRGGVYFEAGYALGRGQKVIYSCRQDHMGKAHFDIRNYQHIVWTDAADFKEKLIYKIEAFIKD